jgi:hypothetical protein
MVQHPINELICRVFSVRNMAHLEHWKTGSFAAHEALGSFYEGIIGSLDGIVELHQGLFGKVSHKEDEELEERLEEFEDIIERLKDDVKFINKNRSEISSKVPAIENLVDELISLYGSTIYKLRFLS